MSPTARPPLAPFGDHSFSILVRPRPVRASATVVLALRGEIDAASVPALRRLRDQLQPPPARIVVITSRVDFIDSAGLAGLVALGSPTCTVELRGASAAVQLLLGAMEGHLPQGLVVSSPRGRSSWVAGRSGALGDGA